MTPTQKIVLAALRANVEGEIEAGWGDVYLDNARPAGMSARAFASHLGGLTKLDLYRSLGDDCFGTVKLEPKPLPCGVRETEEEQHDARLWGERRNAKGEAQ